MAALKKEDESKTVNYKEIMFDTVEYCKEEFKIEKKVDMPVEVFDIMAEHTYLDPKNERRLEM